MSKMGFVRLNLIGLFLSKSALQFKVLSGKDPARLILNKDAFVN